MSLQIPRTFNHTRAYERHLDPDKHEVGKQNTQKIERKNLNFRTWIKRLLIR
jgi:IS1 family transposase